MLQVAKRVLRPVYHKIKNKVPLNVRAYWEDHNVTLHQQFTTAEESLNYLDWRNDQYPGYIDLMPHEGKDGMVVLDYGCGPGHDLVGFGAYSKPKRLIGADVSRVSLDEAKKRLKLHDINAEILVIDPLKADIPLESNSVDFISSSGVLHHIEDEKAVLKEFYRIMKPGSKCRIMVYNYNSLWMHLYTAYHKRIVENKFNDVSMKEAFARTTDGEGCPIAKCYTPDEFVALTQSLGFKSKFIGAAVSLYEQHLAKDIPMALMNLKLPKENRKFLLELTFNDKNVPYYKGDVAGIDACYELEK